MLGTCPRSPGLLFDNSLPIPDAESLPFSPLVLKLVVCGRRRGPLNHLDPHSGAEQPDNKAQLQPRTRSDRKARDEPEIAKNAAISVRCNVDYHTTAVHIMGTGAYSSTHNGTGAYSSTHNTTAVHIMGTGASLQR